MRRMIAAMVMVATLASPALAQRMAPPPVAPPVVAGHGGWSGGPMGAPSLPRGAGPRWGGTVGGRWWGGMQAPGGWHAYRRPSRGFVLPSYWLGADFVIADFVDFGLDSPPYGYHWARYYDDAVLIDDGGHVWDSVHGLDWDRLDRVAPPPPQPIVYEGAGRDDRYYDYGRGADYARPPVIVRPQAQGYTQTFVAGSGGSYTVPGGVTTITIESAPVVTTTTTTTDYVESYGGRRTVRHVYRPHRAARRCCCCCR